MFYFIPNFAPYIFHPDKYLAVDVRDAACARSCEMPVNCCPILNNGGNEPTNFTKRHKISDSMKIRQAQNIRLHENP